MFEDPIVSLDQEDGSVDLSGLSILLHPDEFEGVRLAARNLASDLEKVTGRASSVIQDQNKIPQGDAVIVVGSVQKCRYFDDLGEHAREITRLEGKWETFRCHVQDSPWPSVKKVYVVAGSDKRGAIFGVYTLTEQMGVSPWYWWADVSIKTTRHIYALPGPSIQGEPSVKYRGIFINDETPCLTDWVHEKIGPKYTSEFYVRVFELLLRMKANFLWPAMWSGFPWPGSSFFEDDPRNQELADTYGIVMSTSHHEPMQRGMTEWRTANKGEWSWEENEDAVKEYFKVGAERARPYESIVTMGMRGNGDKRIIAKDPQRTLQEVLDTQRDIFKSAYGREDGVPQVFALYKETQLQYERGLQVPEDITLMFTDDNFGNVRRFPTAEESKRKGGIGLYYHLEYVGRPRSYKWINSSPLGKVQQQLTAAYRNGIQQVWVFNVGDIKPMEMPSSFALALAWDINCVQRKNVESFFSTYAVREFGKNHANTIAKLLYRHDRLIALRRHEHIEPNVFSVVNYREAEVILEKWLALEKDAQSIFEQVPDHQKAAFFQLVLHPIKASRIFTALRTAQAQNQLYGLQRRNTTNVLAKRALDLFDEDFDLQEQFHNNPWTGDKWNHIMSQPHYGYSTETWHAPSRDMITGLSYIQKRQNTNRVFGQIGVSVEGHGGVRPGLTNEESDYTHPSQGDLIPGLTLPLMSPYGPAERFFEIFSRGAVNVEWEVTADQPWITLSATSGTSTPDDERDARISVAVEWEKVPEDFTGNVVIHVQSPSGYYENVHLPIDNCRVPSGTTGFVEADGAVVIEPAAHEQPTGYEIYPLLGRTGSGAVTISPGTSGKVDFMRFPIYAFSAPTKVTITLLFTMCLEVRPDDPLRFDIGLDDEFQEGVQLLTCSERGELPDGWPVAVQDLVWTREVSFSLPSGKDGQHVVLYRPQHAELLLEKIMVDFGGLRQSYLGPGQSVFLKDA